jgi:hypothetical protein
MDCWISCAADRAILRVVAVTATTVLLAAVVASGAVAQTLTEPKPQTKSSAASVAAKSQPAKRVKSCGIFGAGFVHVPGTDACVKIGGSVSAEGMSSYGR